MKDLVRTKQIKIGVNYLIKADPKLAPVIAQHGMYSIEPHTNYYHQLVSSIIGQQLSVKAAAKIKERFLGLFDNKFPSPENILEISDEQIKGVGFSRPKVGYIKDLAVHILDGKLDIDNLPNMTNDEVIKELTAVKGIGVWTAHMFLIFSIGRLDILANGDLGVRVAIKRLYGLEENPSPDKVIEIAEKNDWYPYESLACWYLWRSLNNEPIK